LDCGADEEREAAADAVDEEADVEDCGYEFYYTVDAL
jgi:hypothetical protein